MEITSLTNPKYKQWLKYHQKKYRNQDQKFLIEGKHLIEEAHKAHLIECIIILEGSINPFCEYPTYEIPNKLMEKLTMHVSNETIMAVCHYFDASIVKKDKLIILDNVQDPGNIGTIIRSAYSFGYDGIILSENSCDIYNDKLIRSTKGSIFHIPVIQTNIHDFIDTLNNENYHLYATTLENSTPLKQVTPQYPLAIILGNEGNGISKEIIAKCTDNITIEMNNFESLNVAIAASICMYKFM